MKRALRKIKEEEEENMFQLTREEQGRLGHARSNQHHQEGDGGSEHLWIPKCVSIKQHNIPFYSQRHRERILLLFQFSPLVLAAKVLRT